MPFGRKKDKKQTGQADTKGGNVSSAPAKPSDEKAKIESQSGSKTTPKAQVQNGGQSGSQTTSTSPQVASNAGSQVSNKTANTKDKVGGQLNKNSKSHNAHDKAKAQADSKAKSSNAQGGAAKRPEWMRPLEVWPSGHKPGEKYQVRDYTYPGDTGPVRYITLTAPPNPFDCGTDSTTVEQLRKLDAALDKLPAVSMGYQGRGKLPKRKAQETHGGQSSSKKAASKTGDHGRGRSQTPDPHSSRSSSVTTTASRAPLEGNAQAGVGGNKQVGDGGSKRENKSSSSKSSSLKSHNSSKKSGESTDKKGKKSAH